MLKLLLSATEQLTVQRELVASFLSVFMGAGMSTTDQVLSLLRVL